MPRRTHDERNACFGKNDMYVRIWKINRVLNINYGGYGNHDGAIHRMYKFDYYIIAASKGRSRMRRELSHESLLLVGAMTTISLVRKCGTTSSNNDLFLFF